MKLYLLLLASVFFSYEKSICQNLAYNSIEIDYISYEVTPRFINKPLLKFYITNYSNDTLYISKKNILIQVFKGNKRLLEEKIKPKHFPPNSITFCPFVRPYPPMKTFGAEQHRQYYEFIDSLKQNFAQKLFTKNFTSNQMFIKYKEEINYAILEDCVILMPNETTEYSVIFSSSLFDKSCKVKVKYLNQSFFTNFIDENGKNINIYK